MSSRWSVSIYVRLGSGCNYLERKNQRLLLGGSQGLNTIDSHHIVLPTSPKQQREMVSERACSPNQLARTSERAYSSSQLRTIFERPRPWKMLKWKATTQSNHLRIHTLRLMTSLRVSTAGIPENSTYRIPIAMKRTSRLRCQRKN